jgi:imidazolonepropionase-like amidohydrolase
MKILMTRRPALWLASLLVLSAPTWAASPFQEEGGGGGEEGGEEVVDPEDESDWLAVVGGDVYTGTGAMLRGATVLARKGKIRRIGHDLFVPKEAEVIDATGLRVYPGLVAISSSGLFGDSGSDIADTVDPFNSRMVLALASGITSAAQGDTAGKLKRGEIEGVVMREKYLVSQNYTSSNPPAKRSLEEKLEKAAAYLRAYRQWEEDKKTDKDLKEPSRKGVDGGVLSILRGETLAKFQADGRSDLLAIARLARKYGFRPVIEGCVEGWTVAEELGRAGAFAILTPRTRRDRSEELVRKGGSSIENAAILHSAGVQISIIPGSTAVNLGGIAGRDILHLPIEAGFAVRGGLSEEAAIEAMTIVPARLLGIDHRVGTLEPGKDCDLILTDGDILHYQTFVQYAVVDGKQVYDKSAELYYAHIRPLPERSTAPEERSDPGEASEPEPEPEPEGEGGGGGEGEDD